MTLRTKEEEETVSISSSSRQQQDNELTPTDKQARRTKTVVWETDGHEQTQLLYFTLVLFKYSSSFVVSKNVVGVVSVFRCVTLVLK
jgi:hypothetical protein